MILLVLLPWQWGFLWPLSGKKTAYTLQFQAFAPNAGGQKAYALRANDDEYEWSLFSNTYLMTGSIPLTGVVLHKRFPICDMACFWQFYVQTGLGVSSGGVLAEITWGTVLFWVARVDVSTQIFAARDRAFLWSYPLWLGITFPF